MQDSNLRPTAPEGGGQLNDAAQMEAAGHALDTGDGASGPPDELAQLRELATEVLRRIAAADPFAITAATRLAELTLETTRAAALREAARETTG